MGGVSGESAVCNKLMSIPAVHNHANVFFCERHKLLPYFFFLSLLKPCLSLDRYSRTLRLDFTHLHYESFLLNKCSLVLCS